MHHRLAHILLVTAAAASTLPMAARTAQSPEQTPPEFEAAVQPFVARHCASCHGAKMKVADLDLESMRDAKAAREAKHVWEKVLDRLRLGQMPPPGRPQPAVEDLRAVIRWIESAVRPAAPGGADPGRVTARRLNRFEYNNTIRDLVGFDFRPADDFPADDSGYGFDNIGDVLSLSPVLMEKYLAAADAIARRAVVVARRVEPTIERYKAEMLRSSGAIRCKHRFAARADYDLRAGLGGLRPDGSPLVVLSLSLDGREVKTWQVNPARGSPRNFDLRLEVDGGEHELGLEFVGDTFKPEENPIGPRDRYLAIDFIELRGPFNPRPPQLTEAHRRIIACGHDLDRHEPACAAAVLAPLARRAYRRRVVQSEIDALVHLVRMVEHEGDSFEQGVRVALQAILVSPHFLFRIERDPAPSDPTAVHPISNHELATRLSYFLWSTMPDDALLRRADEAGLREPGGVEAEVRRMLADPKSKALVENFAGQWLQIRNLDFVEPDPERFPSFDRELRDAMRRETELFFEAMIREDRSILDFIDGRFTYLNERLARHYGIRGVTGDEFRRVKLDGAERSGIVTHASVLTVSSYPTRTSPVLRGKWLLENFLNAPPPPPPPGVANLDETAVGSSGSLRQQLEKHRSQPTCAVCHTRMDALGFGLENYDATGAWRTRDGKFAVDAAGELPGGEAFRNPRQLKSILKKDRDAFCGCLTEKMLTYALGRGLEQYDKPVVDSICRRLSRDGYRMSRLIVEIAASLPFQNRRGEEGKRR